MNYTCKLIHTELSIEDKQILKSIELELEKITLRKSYVTTKCDRGHSLRTGTTDQPNARQSVFRKNKPSLLYKKYPHIMDLFEIFINSHSPSFKFSSVYINKNTVCKKHVDSKNTGESLIVSFGDFTGGEIVLYNNQNSFNDKSQPYEINIQYRSLIFDGSKIYHSSNEFEGLRYSIVFF